MSMWDFSLGRTIGAVMRTLPFIGLRMLVYFGVGAAYLLATGTGAGFGWGIGHFWADPDAPAGAAFWGGMAGFAIVSAALYLAREYVLYLVKAAHIAVLVEIYDGRPVPQGGAQLALGSQYVKAHFAQSSILFGVDQIIKGVLRALFRIVNIFTAFLPIPALQSLIRFAETVVRMSLTYVDEIILAYLIRTRTTNPWQTAEDGLVLYAQNYKHFLKNALWLSAFLWGFTILIFFVLLAPAAALLALLPGELGAWGFAFAFIFAWAFKAAVMEPFAIFALMQVYFETVEGQTPNPEWKAKLASASSKFHDLGQRALDWTPIHREPPTSGPTVPAA
jgi:hypothetical protein